MSILESYFGSVPDPRGANASYRLGDLIVMMIAASLCGPNARRSFLSSPRSASRRCRVSSPMIPPLATTPSRGFCA